MGIERGMVDPLRVSRDEAALVDNPHSKFFDASNRGYVRCDVDRTRWLTTFKGVSPRSPGSALTQEADSFTAAAFAVENGRPGAVPGGTDGHGGPLRGRARPRSGPERIN